MPIRHARRQDLQVLVALNAVVQDVHHQAHPDRFKPPGPQIIPWFERWFDQDHVELFLYEEGGRALGYVVAVDRVRPESPFSYERRSLELDQIAVLPECRRRGVGRALIEHVIALADARGLEVELGVWAFNERAQSTFAALGFTPLKGTMVRPRG